MTAQRSAPTGQRICSTRGCGRVLSPGAVSQCRTCYTSHSYASQQRAEQQPSSVDEEKQPVMTAQRDREKVTVERERVTITATQGSIKTVGLKGGGHVTVNIVADIFRLTADDRELVIGLVDALNAFEQGKPFPSFHHCACEHHTAVLDNVRTVLNDGYCLICSTDVDEQRPHQPGCAQAVLEASEE